MEMTTAQLQTKLVRDYYKYFSKYARGKAPEKKVAWVTSFTPVEILSALDMEYYYPESYAAVIAASEKEQALLETAEKSGLPGECCAYSCCFEGCILEEEGPRGLPPRPDIMIATNNQCNTLPNWWNILAKRYDVPLIVLDYPGDVMPSDRARKYVDVQHRDLIAKLEELTGNTLEIPALDSAISNSREAVRAWSKILGFMPVKDMGGTNLFDAITYLITSRCREETAMLYDKMAEDIEEYHDANESLVKIFWLGYPLWYHPDRYLSEELGGCRITGSNYLTWWNLDYSGMDCFDVLFHAYNFTFLNLNQNERTDRLVSLIKKSGAAGTVSLRNKSCKCDFVSAKNVGLPQVELEIDMIDRTYLDVGKARKQIALLKEMICTG